ncbi:MAG: PEP-CTERM sorting domain-containing protein [Candidatus Aureabacteria bacterium]|nr:PEP-CTERM sorting domain-containing protein [Candidatus Auribacterota bacterium]
MKGSVLLVALFVCASLISLPNYAVSGLLTNGGFETGTPGWYGDTATVIEGWTRWGSDGWYHTDYNHTAGGSKAIKSWSDSTGIYQDFAVTAATQYTVSGFAYAPSTDTPVGWDSVMKIEWFNGASKLSEEEVGRFISGTDSLDTWKEIAGLFTAPTSADTGRIVMFLTDANGETANGGSIGWDDMDVDVVPEPGSLVLLGCGLAGIFLAKRRNG